VEADLFGLGLTARKDLWTSSVLDAADMLGGTVPIAQEDHIKTNISEQTCDDLDL
jgi:hypothetical protein